MSRQKTYAHGHQMARYLGAPQREIVTTTLALTQGMALTRVRHDGAGTGMSSPVPGQHASMLVFQMQPLPAHELWIDGKSMTAAPLPTGTTSVINLERGAAARLDSAFDCTQLYIPGTVIDGFVAEHGTGPMIHRPLAEFADPVLARIGAFCAHLLAFPDELNPLLADALVLTVLARLACAEGRAPGNELREHGGLAPWQERRAKDMIEAALVPGVRLDDLAAACGVSCGHFSRAFKRTTGIPPYLWLQHRRVLRAKHLLATTRISLAEVALACGFVDQSHLTRQFQRLAGIAPSRWRRAQA